MTPRRAVNTPKHRILAVISAGLALGAMPSGAAAASNADIEVIDACDPVTFDQALGAGACSRPADDGGPLVTVDEFVARLQRKRADPTWRFSPAKVTIKHGTPLTIAMTRGGERHTVTEVPSFGLGCIAAINALVFPDEDPNAFPAVCDDPLTFQPGATVPGGTSIRPGERFSVTGLARGEHRYFCAIHPWMKTTVKVK